MFKEISVENFEPALDILERGFTKRSREFWRNTLESITRFNQDEGASDSPGYLLFSKNEVVGIILVAVSFREGGAEPLKLVNMSCWYIDPSYRMLGPAMMLKVMSDKNCIYTDFTPSPSVQSIIDLHKFKLYNEGISFIPTFQYVFPSFSSAKCRFDVDLADIDDKDLKRLVSHHRDLPLKVGCLTVGDEDIYFVLKLRNYARIPSGILVYCSNNSLFYENIGQVARSLLVKKIFFLQVDVLSGIGVPGIKRKGRSRKYFKNSSKLKNNRTDYLGSELSLIDYQ